MHLRIHQEATCSKIIWDASARTGDFYSLPSHFQKACIASTPIYVTKGRKNILWVISGNQNMPFLQDPKTLHGRGYYSQKIIIFSSPPPILEIQALAFAPIAQLFLTHLKRDVGLANLRKSINENQNPQTSHLLWGKRNLLQERMANLCGVERGVIKGQDNKICNDQEGK